MNIHQTSGTLTVWDEFDNKLYVEPSKAFKRPRLSGGTTPKLKGTKR